MSENDKKLLLDLWRWKFLTTAALTELHFGKIRPSSAYRKLIKLRDRGWVRTIPILGDENGRSFAWTLTPKSFRIVTPWLGTLKEVGFRSETPDHDLVVNAAHLGEWIYGVPEKCALYTEQELRRRFPEQYPSWIPESNYHRPDGYWRTCIDGQCGTIALEVELTQKSPTDYRKTASFYASRPELFRVFWIVAYPGLARLIQEAINITKGPGMKLHSFVLQKDFESHGWKAPFFLGRDIGKSFATFLLQGVSTSRQHVAPTLLLNASKSPHRSQTYVDFKKSLISHRVGPTLFAPTTLSELRSTIQKGVHTNDQNND